MVYGTFDDTEVGQVNYNEYGGSEFPEGKRENELNNQQPTSLVHPQELKSSIAFFLPLRP